jgi:hypothetical protein
VTSPAARRQQSTGNDPATRLTEAERDFIKEIDAHMTREEVLSDLKACLQLAVQVELATIPIYLFTYYSIVRNAASGEGIDPVQAFANKAAGVIMSVAVEEMLHMSLSANVLFAMGGAPQMYGKAPESYPALLPGHKVVGPPGPDGETSERIPLAKLSLEQLWHFLQVEYPEALDANPQKQDWDTIGQLYSYVRCLLESNKLSDADFQRGAAAAAIQPYNYSPNNVDTVYPTGKFDPWKPAPPTPAPAWSDGYPSAAEAARFANYADSHAGKSQLLCVSSRLDAIDAIDTICDQGEGYPVPNLGASAYADTSKGEDSHYMKFLRLQAQFSGYADCREKLPSQPPPPPPQLPTITQEALDERDLVVAFPRNPTSGSYPAKLQPIANFSSALFQYMLIMVETIYKVPPEGQKLFFNEGLHRSMIWVMDKYFLTIREIPIGNGEFMAPVFENFSLGDQATSFQALATAAQATVDATTALVNELDPDDPLVSVYNNVAFYAALAVGKPASVVGSARPLPDVGPYWRQ